ncbi:MAG: GTPase ObgE [Epsilonproteobacteria bacterium]|nr:GTPase ObgE [Campylobacterota bacterium]NPA89699.1 GTPase ObgE [Campylobacterota bacterium]
MFVDKVELILKSGKGGAGCVSFRREKFIPKGGPDGGDGGKGGDVIIYCDNNTDTLAHLKGKRVLKAKNGRPGEGKKKHGADGEDLIVVVPPGTIIKEKETGKVLLELTQPGERRVLLEGGKGGLGNWHFRGSRNQVPRYAQPGEPGKELKVIIELKLIADVGLVGFPNAGKSTLISALSNARPQIANYEFTTLTPKLGVVEIGDGNQFVMADIPGIIEGASEGKGLGLEFLRHIERTKVILFVIDLLSYRDPVYQWKSLKKELRKYSPQLAQRRWGIALNKVDGVEPSQVEEVLKKLGYIPTSPQFGADPSYPAYFGEKGEFVLPISGATGFNLKPLKFALWNLIQKAKEEEDKGEIEEGTNF